MIRDRSRFDARGSIPASGIQHLLFEARTRQGLGKARNSKLGPRPVLKKEYFPSRLPFLLFPGKTITMARIIGKESKNVIKNILISVITTVTGAFAVYFLGFNNKGSGPNKLETEERTIETWKTLVTIENIYTKNTTILLRDALRLGNFIEAGEESERESKKMVTSLRGLADKPGIDVDLKTLLERRIMDEESQRPLMKGFYLHLENLVDRAVEEKWVDAQMMDSLLTYMNNFNEQNKGLSDRVVADAETLASLLAERYDYPFNVEDFLIVQIVRNKLDVTGLLEDEKNKPVVKEGKIPGKTGSLGALKNVEKPADYFAGEWNANGAKITFERNGKLSWIVPNEDAHAIGSWKFDDDKLTMNVTNSQTGKKAVWVFNLSGVDEKSFSMVLNKEPYNYYRLVRK